MTHKVILGSEQTYDRAMRILSKTPKGYIFEVKEPTRTLDQNNMLWSLLTDISVACPMGRRHTPDDWKAIAMNACGWECQFVEGLDGRPFPKGFRSSNLTKSQMSTLIDFLQAFGAEHEIAWTHDTVEDAA